MKKLGCVIIPRMLLVAATVAGLCQCATAASQVVWQIGKFDRSSSEFTLQLPPEPKPGAAPAKADVEYTVGKNKAETDWPAMQAGSSIGQAGFRPHPYAIRFDLPSTPRGLYTLKVGLMVETPRISRLEVEINGHRGLYFQHPQLDYTGGDVVSVFLPQYSYNTITAELPTKFLHQGSNELVLTANDHPADRDDFTLSGLAYDALELDQDASARFSPGELAIQAVPTIFYTQKDAALNELVDVYIHSNSNFPGGQATLMLGKAKYT